MISPAHIDGGGRKVYPLHPAERLLVGIVTVHLCFLPWALGDMHVWSQVISLLLAALGFGACLLPRHYTPDYSLGAPSFRMPMLSRLLRFPLFWIGGLFLLYILIQGLNPAWRYVRTEQYWWLERVPYVTWLPHGMITPFAMAGPWRSLVIYGSVWLTVCSVWVGFTRRKSLRVFLTALAVNGFLLALLGLAERMLHADRIFWSYEPPATYFVSSFIYKNHAGAYFDLMIGVCCAMAAWHHARSRRRLEKSSPSGMFAFFVIVLALMVVFSYARAATILMLCYLAFVAALFFGRQFVAENRSRNSLAIIGLLAVLFGGAALVSLYFLPTGEALDRMGQLMKTYQSAGPTSRRIASQATVDLYQASPIYGWGSGGFRFAFPAYQRRYPQISMENGRPLYWEHAHDDYAELLAELGLTGSAILLVGGAYWAVRAMCSRVWRHVPALLVAAACGLTLVHCVGEFNFFNPAILGTWAAVAAVALRWAELEPAGS